MHRANYPRENLYLPEHRALRTFFGYWKPNSMLALTLPKMQRPRQALLMQLSQSTDRTVTHIIRSRDIGKNLASLPPGNCFPSLMAG
jgi:hypothetical protein